MRGEQRTSVALGVSLLVFSAASALVLAQSNVINGAYYWRWAYQASPVTVFWPLSIAGSVTVLYVLSWRLHKCGASLFASLGMIAAASFLLRLSTAWLFSQNISLDFIDYVVRHPIVGSYFAVAETIHDRPDVLTNYPEWMASMPLHAVNKPPGLVLFNYLFVHLFGSAPAQLAAAKVGIACGLMSLFSIPLIYALVKTLGGSRMAAFHAGALLSLCPGAVIFFPLFDPLLAVPVLAMAVAWARANCEDRWIWSAVVGVVLAITLFFTFNVLPVGFFLLLVGFAAPAASWHLRFTRLARHSLLALLVATTLHAVFAFATSFDLLATFEAALVNQRTLLKHILRPYPDTIWWDLVDYALGVAWLPVVLAVFYSARLSWPLRWIDMAVLAGAAQLAITAISALLPGETARVWNFFIPLVVLPAALELEHWPRRAIAAIYFAMAFLTALLARSMVFMYAGA